MKVPKRLKREGEVRMGMSGLGMTNTELGDRVEAALAKRAGWKALHSTYRQGSFDVEGPDGIWYEVKACSVYASEYKAKPSAKDVREKLAYALGCDREPGTIIAVVDKKMRAWIYRRDGLGSFRLGDTGLGWTFVGKVKV